MNTWYENYIERVRKDAENVQPANEIGQNILHLKAIGSKAFEDVDNCYTFSVDVDGERKFGFSEQLVNQLMQFAFDQGRKDIDENSFNAGHAQCWQEILNKLDITECDGECGEN